MIPVDDLAQPGHAVVERGPDGVARYRGLPSSLVAMLRTRARDGAGVPAVAEVDGPALDHAQLWERVTRTAGGLRARGVRRGDRVALLLPAGVDWTVGFLAAIVCGAIAVPVNTRLAEPERAAVLDDADPAVVLAEPADLPEGEPFADDALGGTDPAAIFYTSGTTGAPKGVVMTHEGLLTNAENAVRCFELDGLVRDRALRTLIVVPLFHVTGCNSQLLVALYGGGSTTILPRFDAERALALIESERTTLLIGVPAVFELVVRRPGFDPARVGHVGRIGYGGAASSPASIARLQQAFPNARLYNAFGQTETSALTSVLPAALAEGRHGSVGVAVPVADLALADADPDTGVGELLVRSPTVMRGYWRRPGLTETVLRDGWLHTGDLARFGDGVLWIVDRMKDVINRGGEKVYCVEIESVLAAMPGVAESAAVPVPDDVMGEKVGIAVVTEPGSGVTAADVVAFLSPRLADYKVPQFVSVSERPLPRNPAGKLVKARIRETSRWGPPLR